MEKGEADRNVKRTYMIQGRCIARGKTGPWEDYPDPKNMAGFDDIYKAMKVRDEMAAMAAAKDGVHGEIGKFTRDLYATIDAKMEVRIVKRTTVDEVIEEPEKIIG